MKKSIIAAGGLCLLALGGLGLSPVAAGAGKPANGSVGVAYNMSKPAPQATDGSDANRGWRCDDNLGVGQGNPAFPGCSPSPTPTPTTSAVFGE